MWTEQEYAGTTLLFTLSITPDGQAMNVTYFYCNGGTLCVRLRARLRAAARRGIRHRQVSAEGHAVGRGRAPSGAHGVAGAGREGDYDRRRRAHARRAAPARRSSAEHSYDFTPFATVDCSACASPGWYELHVLLHRAGEACYGVLYLFPDEPTRAQIAWTLCLPSLTQPDGKKGVNYDVTWSGSFPPDIAPVAPPYPWHPPPGR